MHLGLASDHRTTYPHSPCCPQQGIPSCSLKLPASAVRLWGQGRKLDERHMPPRVLPPRQTTLLPCPAGVWRGCGHPHKAGGQRASQGLPPRLAPGQHHSEHAPRSCCLPAWQLPASTWPPPVLHMRRVSVNPPCTNLGPHPAQTLDPTLHKPWTPPSEVWGSQWKKGGPKPGRRNSPAPPCKKKKTATGVARCGR